MNTSIYHLAEPQSWAASGDEYSPGSLEEEGFIHCSTADQLSRTAREMFIDRNDLILLTIDADQLGDAVVYEDLYDLDEQFPHIYGPIPATTVINTGPYLTHLEEGLWLTETRFDIDWMERILHPDFSEVGMSGKTYTRAQTLSMEPVDLEIDLPLDGFTQTLIDEDVMLNRYVSRGKVAAEELIAERSSLWINTNEGWRLRYHQGTPVQNALRQGSPALPKNELPELLLPDESALREWLIEHHARSPGVRLVLGKKGGAVTSLNWDQAVDQGLCFGWIDGQAAKRDEESWTVRFTPRTKRSRWSKKNVERVTRLEAQGLITESGWAAIQAAKEDGRWDEAYEGPANAKVPQDLATAIEADPDAAEMFTVLTSQNRFAMIARLDAIKRQETRRRVIAEYVEMLARHETPYPQKRRPG